MCALCEKPEVCDYPDIYSGYEGALRCLAHNGGEVAWTKVIYVKRFFGLPVGMTPAVPTSENPADYRYFCPDGSKVPIDANTKPCTWAARPWQGYMANNAVKDVEAVQKVPFYFFLISPFLLLFLFPFFSLQKNMCTTNWSILILSVVSLDSDNCKYYWEFSSDQ